MLLQILAHTPVYIWLLLAGLVALGWKQSRDRLVGPLQVVARPALMLGLGAWSLAPGLAALPVGALVWLGAMVLGVAHGLRTPPQPGTAWLANAGRFRLPGSWAPMGFILLVFALRYASSAAAALHPEWRDASALQTPLALLVDLGSGLSIGHCVGHCARLLRMTRRPRGAGATATMSLHA